MPTMTDDPMVVTKPDDQQAEFRPITCWLFGRKQIAEYLGISARLVTDWVVAGKLRVKPINDHYYMAKPETLDEDVEKMSALYQHHKREKEKKQRSKEIKEQKGRY